MSAAAGAARAFAACLLLGSLAVFGTYAVRLSVAEVAGTFSVGQVRIGVESRLPQGTSMASGGELPVGFAIRGYGEDCYIRCKDGLAAEKAVSSSGFGTESPEPAVSGFCGAPDPRWWVAGTDGYVYCKNVLRRGETVLLSQTVGDPFAGEGGSFRHVLTVEAVQARHFSPDFASGSPWGEVQVQDVPGAFFLQRVGGGACYSVEYEGEAQGFQVSAEDFFRHFGTLVPGDVRQGTVRVSNGSSSPVLLGLGLQAGSAAADAGAAPGRLGGESGSAGSPEPGMEILMDAVQLRIVRADSPGDTLFEGSLSSLRGSRGVALGRFAPGEECGLAFRVSLPASLDNRVAGLAGKVAFRFTADAVSCQEPGWEANLGEPAGAGVLAGSAGTGCPSASLPVRSALAKTADFLAPVAPALLAVAAFALAAAVGVFLRLRRRGGVRRGWFG